jgi:hypothetical protein
MREFADIEQELRLEKFLDSRNGTLYCVAVGPGAPRLLVRRFDRDLPPSFVPVYASLLAAASAWIATDPELAALVWVEQPKELGRDFLARRHVNATSLDAYMETDPEEDPPEAPPELEAMQQRFLDRRAHLQTARDRLLATVLSRSILERTTKTMYEERTEQFVIADLRPTRDELEDWQRIDEASRPPDEGVEES